MDPVTTQQDINVSMRHHSKISNKEDFCFDILHLSDKKQQANLKLNYVNILTGLTAAFLLQENYMLVRCYCEQKDR